MQKFKNLILNDFSESSAPVSRSKQLIRHTKSFQLDEITINNSDRCHCVNDSQSHHCIRSKVTRQQISVSQSLTAPIFKNNDTQKKQKPIDETQNQQSKDIIASAMMAKIQATHAEKKTETPPVHTPRIDIYKYTGNPRILIAFTGSLMY